MKEIIEVLTPLVADLESIININEILEIKVSNSIVFIDCIGELETLRAKAERYDKIKGITNDSRK